MWIHVPNTPSTSSASAPEEAALIGPLSWQSRRLALCCVWRGKHSPSLIWSSRCNSTSWLRRLSGAMCEPSLADASAARWMASLAASPASPTALPESASAEKTSATSGVRLGESSSPPARGLSSSKTSAECSPKAAPSEFEETFSAWAARLRAASSARRKLARAMNGSGYSFSGWPTATASMVTGAGSSGRDGGDNLQTAASAWPTPAARDFKGVDRTDIDRGNARPLNEVVAHWSTPRASDGEKGGPNQSFGAGGVPLVAQSVSWPTPTSLSFAGSHQPGNSRSYNSTMELADARWMTPRVTTGDYTRDGGAKGSERLTLEGQAKWQTPSVADVTGGHKSRSGARKSEPLLNGQAADLSSLLARPTETSGVRSPNAHLSAYLRFRATTCSELRSERRALLLMGVRRRDQAKPGEIRRLRRGWTKAVPTAFIRPSFRKSLNPRFIGDLMGWPPGLTSFECSETASSIWRARMRSALSQLTLRDAPAAQLSLFA